MKAKQWLKTFQRALALLPRAERERAADYYAELFADRMEAGEEEESIARELGDPAAAARAVLSESGAGEAAPAARKAGRPGWQKALLACGIGVPAVIAIIALGCIAVALATSGVLLILAGLGGTGSAFLLIAFEGFSGGLLALGGIMLAAAGVGCMLAPPLLLLIRLLFKLCGTVWGGTAALVRGKREGQAK